MEIHESDYIVGIWFGGSDAPPRRSDILISLLRREDKWVVLEWRFRYHVDDKMFDSEDEKNFYGTRLPVSEAPTEEAMLEKLDPWLRIMRLKYTDIKFYPVRGGLDKFVKVMERQSILSEVYAELTQDSLAYTVRCKSPYTEPHHNAHWARLEALRQAGQLPVCETEKKTKKRKSKKSI